MSSTLIEDLRQQGKIDYSLRDCYMGAYLLTIDGSQYFTSEKIHCDR